jgi:RNA polymerase sigma-70 factor (ECF subfamily)
MSEAAGSGDIGALLADVAAGDRTAFKRLYDLQAARLYAVALRVTRQPSLAADAVHDALLQVWRNAARFDATRGTPEGWLVSLVRYRALDAARKRVRETSDEGMPEPEDTDPDPLARLQQSEEGRALHLCLGRLEEDRRRLIVLAFVDGLTHQEVAAKLNMPLGTAKSWIRRGLQSLRTCLEAAA